MPKKQRLRTLLRILTPSLQETKEEWKNIRITPKFVIFLLYLVIMLGFLYTDEWFGFEKGPLIFWTVFQAESSYWGWLPWGVSLWTYWNIILVASTIHLTIFWYLVFQDEENALPLYYAKKWMRLEKKGTIHRHISNRTLRGLVFAGVVPMIGWPIGFFWLRQNPTRWGLSAVLTGNAIKLSSFTLAYLLAISMWTPLVIILAVLYIICALPLPKKIHPYHYLTELLIQIFIRVRNNIDRTPTTRS